MDIAATKKPMFISIYAGGMPFNGNTIPSGKSLGGSESAAYYMAKELVKLGNTVTVFTSEEKCGTWDGVRYEWHGETTEVAPLGYRFAFAMRTPQDVVIVQRHPHAFTTAINSKLNIWWLHDLALYRTAPLISNTLLNTDKIFTVSKFHKQQVSKVYGIEEKNIIATKNGVDYKSIREAVSFDANHSNKHRHKHLCFASRPERGLIELVGDNGIMLRLKDYHLHVCNYANEIPAMRDLYQYLYKRCEELPNVTVHGHLSKCELYKLLNSCQLYVYPTMFEDTSNIMAMESAACGTPFIGAHVGALPETCSGNFARLSKPKNSKIDKEAFIQGIRDICENAVVWKQMSNAALSHTQSWEEIAKSWHDIFNNLLANKTKNRTMLIKHFEQQSDIVAMRKMVTDEEIVKVLPDFKLNYDFLINNSFKEHYEAYYEYERERGVNYGPEILDGQPRYECIKDIIKKAQPKTVLDFGCAHGHYTINLAKAFRDTEFVGIDIVESNIDAARKWKDKDKVENVHFFLNDTTTQIIGTYDLIIAAEVLEHIMNPVACTNILIHKLRSYGSMVISVPYGPWEAIGYKEHAGWRAHIHHLERQDLKDMFGHFPDYKCLALPHGVDIGHYICTFSKSTELCNEITYERKFIRQAPRQSLSVCMIVKDEEDNISRCLKAIKDYADEIIIGVDSTTTDRTWDILMEFYLLSIKKFWIESPIDTGFDKARNSIVAQATCDWVLWVDADESIENIELLHKYLRPNAYNGYALPQHHYSAEPPELLQTDYPCRLFRNTKKVQFYGVVHEHPSRFDNMNEGPEPIYRISDVHIMHTGYATEAKRQNRFRRNFPLMKKDRERYPNRILGQALYIRDLSHLIRYEREKNKGAITQIALEAAVEAVELWNDLLFRKKTIPIRYLVDFLPYYSQCVDIINQNEKIAFSSKINGLEINGYFPNIKVIKKLMKILVNEAINIRGLKYW